MNKILVIPKKALDDQNFFSSPTNAEFIDSYLDEYGIYLDRPYAETDPDFLQIIPYVVVHNNNEVFAYTRLKKGAESRLHSKVSIGIGGHVQQVHGKSPVNNYLETISIELNEELNIENSNTLQIQGPFIYIFDDTNEVGKVHLGLLFTCDVGSRKVSVKETEKIEGKMYSITELNTLSNFENWSVIAIEQLGYKQ